MSEQPLQSILDALDMGVYAMDDQGTIFFLNAHAEKLLGWTWEEIRQKDDSFCFCCLPHHEPNHEELPCLGSQDPHDMPPTTEAIQRPFTRKDHSRLAVYGTIAPLPLAGGKTGTVVWFQDLTKAQESLPMRQAREAAQEANRLKDKFVSLVAHDLRAPMSSMVGLMEFLLDDPDKTLQQAQTDLIADMLASGRSLIDMIEDVLNIGRLKTGKIIPDKVFFDLRFLTDSVIHRISHMAEEKQILIENHIPSEVRIHADMNLFAAVTQNLLTNAIKFSFPGQKVIMEQPKDTLSALSVRDHGLGIPPDTLSKLFNVEEKTSTPGTHGETGTGFGLPFSFDIMEAHGGTLTVESIEGEGSLFTATLPHLKPHVMLVDDEPMDRFMVRSVLNQMDLEITEAESGTKALAQMDSQRFHLILSDVKMPEMDGMELLRLLKQGTETRKIPVILITGDEKEETRDLAFRLGADDFVVKPLILHDFFPRVRHHLGG